jgi:hypothetical protein
MWRSFFLAVGIYLVLLGVQCLGVQKFVLKKRELIIPQPTDVFTAQETKLGPNKELVPPPWAPWSLMSTGAVMCLYSFSIPSRIRKK